METKQYNKQLGFIQFLKIRISKNRKNILIFISHNNCVSIPILYMQKLMADQIESTNNEEAS